MILHLDGQTKLPCLLLVIFFICLLVFTKMLSHFLLKITKPCFLVNVYFVLIFLLHIYHILIFFRSILELQLTQLVLFFNLPLAMSLL